MWFVPLLLLGALTVQGDMKLALDESVYPADDSGSVLVVYYEIPHTSLTFHREDGGFVARYRISVQTSDKRSDLVAGDLWQKTVRVHEYDVTTARDSIESGAVSLVVPDAAQHARIEVRDQRNERSALASFRIERPTSGLLVRLYRSGRPAGMPRYGIGDTVVATAEAVSSSDRFDSCRFVLKRERRVVTGATVAVTETRLPRGAEGVAGTSIRRAAVFEYLIGDSAGVARLGGGEYLLEATGFGPGRPLSATERFRVEVPFFLDDSAYLLRVRQLVYIASADESRHLSSVPRGEREQAWHDFWKKKDRSPTTKRNEREEEYFVRIDYAQEHFGHADRGYLSDRGRVYVRYGPPDQVDSRPFDIDAPAYEVWYYYRANKRFEFVDRFGAGEYALRNREELGEW